MRAKMLSGAVWLSLGGFLPGAQVFPCLWRPWKRCLRWKRSLSSALPHEALVSPGLSTSSAGAPCTCRDSGGNGLSEWAACPDAAARGREAAEEAGSRPSGAGTSGAPSCEPAARAPVAGATPELREDRSPDHVPFAHSQDRAASPRTPGGQRESLPLSLFVSRADRSGAPSSGREASPLSSGFSPETPPWGPTATHGHCLGGVTPWTSGPLARAGRKYSHPTG